MLCLRKRQTSATSQPEDRNPKTKSKVNAFSLVRAVFKRPHLLKAAVLCVCAVAFIRKSLVVVRPSVRSSGRSVGRSTPRSRWGPASLITISPSTFHSFPLSQTDLSYEMCYGSLSHFLSSFSFFSFLVLPLSFLSFYYISFSTFASRSRKQKQDTRNKQEFTRAVVTRAGPPIGVCVRACPVPPPPLPKILKYNQHDSDSDDDDTTGLHAG